MTNEEAIKSLNKLKSFHNGSYGTAIDLAIKALRYKPVILKETDAEPRTLNVILDTETNEVYIGRFELDAYIQAGCEVITND